MTVGANLRPAKCSVLSSKLCLAGACYSVSVMLFDVNVASLFVGCKTDSSCGAGGRGCVSPYAALGIIRYRGHGEEEQIDPLLYWVLGNKLPMGHTLT